MFTEHVQCVCHVSPLSQWVLSQCRWGRRCQRRRACSAPASVFAVFLLADRTVGVGHGVEVVFEHLFQVDVAVDSRRYSAPDEFVVVDEGLLHHLSSLRANVAAEQVLVQRDHLRPQAHLASAKQPRNKQLVTRPPFLSKGQQGIMHQMGLATGKVIIFFLNRQPWTNENHGPTVADRTKALTKKTDYAIREWKKQSSFLTKRCIDTPCILPENKSVQ